MIETNETLLERLRRTDAHDAWREFYAAYRGPVLGYAHHAGLHGAAADEVLQDTFVALVKVLPTFCYDRAKGRFRHFLFRIVDHRVRAARGRARRATSRQTGLAEVEGADALLEHPHGRRIEAEWDQVHANWRSALAAEAVERVRRHPGVSARTMAVFDDYVMRNQPASAVAAEHGLNENAVYQIRHRVLTRVQHEFAFLLASAGDAPA